MGLCCLCECPRTQSLLKLCLEMLGNTLPAARLEASVKFMAGDRFTVPF